MKILVVGPNSYIAKHFVSYCVSGNIKFAFSFLSVKEETWEQFSYKGFNSIVYFAAIVHHPEIVDENLYERVNCSIPYSIAIKAKKDGVKQFVYISTVAVWGVGPVFNSPNVIDKNTRLNPNSLYGSSKLKGERALQSMDSEQFKIAILRLPNVYGENCPGSFYSRIKMLSKIRILPTYKNRYPFSLVSVENVAKGIVKVIESHVSGVLCPQDAEIVTIVDRINALSKESGGSQKNLDFLSPLFGMINQLFPNKYLNNLFGGFYVDPCSFPNPCALE